ncbi:biotin--[acetyl-CoA-carboxylase] ligase [Methanobrevibacter thaueri]|uniref:Bifunctional ligase/repressor BirA n=1 Tax=Methanobrevibacter thaueri TaxID=190975 RepID=A0A315XPD6_9EURY|nr:biotin--[acetyl-CoA-carboxylase] ligase [Methanobrevibacter thaueri]PWB88215.1 bifunctional ligase/repressor BirA [Methanobrevibacter thaueri]
MRKEIIELLKKENKLSDEAISELKDINIHDFSEIIEEIGTQPTEHIKASEISKDLDTTWAGKNLYVFDEVKSTNTVAKFLAMNGAENGTVVISEKQTDAKGRSGKAWASPVGGIWLSLIVKPNVDYSKLPMITIGTGVAVAKAIERTGITSAEIKWPNDIIIHDKKVCGILTEAVTTFNTIDSVIIGVGIDANIDIDDFPEELQDGTTTLADELGRKEDENVLIRLFLEEFEKIAETFNEGDYESILKDWRKRSYSVGKIVEVREPFNKNFDAYVVGIGREGALIVEKIDGTLEKVISGECIIKK